MRVIKIIYGEQVQIKIMGTDDKELLSASGYLVGASFAQRTFSLFQLPDALQLDFRQVIHIFEGTVVEIDGRRLLDA